MAPSQKMMQINFETVFTRESSLPEVGSQNRTDVAKIEYAQITCGDVKRVLKSLKKTIPGPGRHSTNPFERTGRRDQLTAYETFSDFTGIWTIAKRLAYSKRIADI